MLAGVKLRQSVVVPKNTIALTRQEHGQTDLCIHLCQSAGESSNIAISILELTESEETLVLGRFESQGSSVLRQFMADSMKQRFPVSVFEYQSLVGIVLFNDDITLFHLIVLHI